MNRMVDRIMELKKEKNAIILAHFYQNPEIQDIADFVGDSLELSRRACEVSAGTIVLCGVYFMAESAKLLNPHKAVLISNTEAGCPMADMVEPKDILELRRQHPNAAVVTYVNSSAAVKAVSDICCTSSNAKKVIDSIDSDEIIFAPDRNLGHYVSRFSDKKFILYNGFCPTHNRVFPEHVDMARREHPNAEVLVHPECIPAVVDKADFVGSTAQIINYATQSGRDEFIIGTEEGILHPLKLKNPNKKFYLLSDRLVCPNMKKTTLEDVLECLETGRGEVTLDEDTMKMASQSLFRMLEIK